MFRQPPRPAQQSKASHDPRLPAASRIHLLKPAVEIPPNEACQTPHGLAVDVSHHLRHVDVINGTHLINQAKPTRLEDCPKQTKAMAHRLLSDRGMWVEAYRNLNVAIYRHPNKYAAAYLFGCR